MHNIEKSIHRTASGAAYRGYGADGTIFRITKSTSSYGNWIARNEKDPNDTLYGWTLKQISKKLEELAARKNPRTPIESQIKHLRRVYARGNLASMRRATGLRTAGKPLAKIELRRIIADKVGLRDANAEGFLSRPTEYKKNPQESGWVIKARKDTGGTDVYHWDGKRFSTKGKPALFPTGAAAVATGQMLMGMFPKYMGRRWRLWTAEAGSHAVP